MYHQPTTPPVQPEEPSQRRMLIAVLIVGAVALACAAAALVGGFMLLRNRPAAAPTTISATDTPTSATQISLEPDSGSLGIPMLMRGTGWVPGEVVVVFLLSPTGSIDQSLTVAVAVADETGAIEKAFTMPKGNPWDQMSELVILARSNRTGHEARATFYNVPPTATSTPTITQTPEPTATPGTPSPTPTSATATPTRTPIFVTDWLGEYWTNQNLQGEPALQRNDEQVDFAWGTGSPAEGIPADHFSARWSRELEFAEGAYIFHVAVDDAARLWVDQRLIINEWHDSGIVEYTAPLYLTGGRHFVAMEYYDSVGNAQAELWWTPVTEFSGWRAEYYENASLSGAPILVRDEAQIDFDWGENAPPGLVTTDNFSVRWTRTLYMDGGIYTFRALVDDGVRMRVDGQLIIDEWHDSLRHAYTKDMVLQAGEHTLRVEYYEHTGGAAAKIWWDVRPLPTATTAPATSTPTATQPAPTSTATPES